MFSASYIWNDLQRTLKLQYHISLNDFKNYAKGLDSGE